MFTKLLAATTIALSTVSFAHADGYTDWSGLYLGPSLGIGSGSADILDIAPGAGPGNFNFIGGNTGIVSSHDMLGAMPGAFIGYRFQHNSYVFGIEASYHEGGTVSDTSPLPPALPAFTNQLDMENLIQVGGQIGMARGKMLFYASGGYARADTKLTVRNGAALAASNGDITSDGYYAGAGFDFNLDNNWSFGGEYNYVNFGDEIGIATVTAGGQLLDYRLNDFDVHVIKFKMTKRFN